MARLPSVAVRRLSVAVILLSFLASGASATEFGGLKSVSYHGFTVRVPASWPVYRLARAPSTCVRFDRHAVYLGRPGQRQSCPAGIVGRTEAILVEPAAHNQRVGLGLRGSATTFGVPGSGLLVTATWGADRDLIARSLGRAALPAPPSLTPATLHSAPARTASGSPAARPILAPRDSRATGGSGYYTGRGFDACSAPSSQAMSAWSNSYHAIGVYVGGVNQACAQPNLTPDWVSQEIAAGWHLIPTYVGLQAPSNGCGCAAMSPTQASAQGKAAATDAVANMQALGLPAGNPVYFDMEAYPHTSSNTSAVLAFLGAWTSQLHTDGYTSGVYSSAASGIADLSAQWGTGYQEPDDIWFAGWNGQQSTSTSDAPAPQWSNHQRLHQYNGGHNETHGGVTINVDSDYLDGAAAGTVAAPATVPPPTLTVSPSADGSTLLRVSWTQGSGLSSWQVLGGSTTSTLTPLATVPAGNGPSTQVVIRGTDAYFEAKALGSGGQVLAASSPVATPAHVIVFGHSAFVSRVSGSAGLPVGCYTSPACHLTTSVLAGHTTVAQTGPEAVGAGGVGTLYFRLNSAGRRLLARARSGRLAVRVTVRDRTGVSVTASLNLVAFLTSGGAPPRSSAPSSALRVIGLTAFVSSGGVGGVLAGCSSPKPCWVRAKLSSGRTALAQTGRELIGANELGYLTFRLSAAGRRLLQSSRSNQLAARVTLGQPPTRASASIVLTRF